MKMQIFATLGQRVEMGAMPSQHICEEKPPKLLSKL